jgi:hypothetical protein
MSIRCGSLNGRPARRPSRRYAAREINRAAATSHGGDLAPLAPREGEKELARLKRLIETNPPA